MKLRICGGVGEHGRNCFYVETEDLRFLVDCGIKISDIEDPYPHLNDREINKLDAVFLTHSHNDHTGAINFICDRGFNGDIIASFETLSQIPFQIKNKVTLESISKGKRAFYKRAVIDWGRTGHCAGAVWYKFYEKDKSILFSGDYTENSLIYECDLLRNIKADFAIIDSAYGKDDTDIYTYRRNIVDKTEEFLKSKNLIAFPVPKYGRGIEIFKILSDNLKDVDYFGDQIFLNSLEKFKKDKFWHKKIQIDRDINLYDENESGIVFISDAQLKNKISRRTVDKILSMNGTSISTGTVYDGTYADELVKEGKMYKLRYPVHQNYGEYLKILKENNFLNSIPYHSKNLNVKKKDYII
ncbi:MBL fold metallo-hydrolase [Peptoniphilus sp.]|jgi:hypothetical protein|uniref:MBL fold metallo-hydrolase n=1 Tax=Peptoniphilus sp. TaxID=1971214 RepID=UPI003D929C4D